MAVARFNYAAEKFAAARRSLMLPHPRGEAASIADAFHECSLGLEDIEDDWLEEPARDWVNTLNHLMDTEGIEDPKGLGTHQLKAERLTESEMFDLSRVVDELAWWFHEHN
jgi:hypothetical protein